MKFLAQSGKGLSLIVAIALYATGAKAATFTDNFDRSNGGLGSNWTAVPGYGGTLQITGNQVQPAAEIFAGSIYTAATVAPAQFSEVQLVSGLSGGVINLDVRAGQYGNLSTADMYRGQALGLDGIWRILRVDNGVETVLESGALTASNGDTFYFEANGSTLTLKRNGTVLGSATDSTYGSGAVGLSIYNHVNMLVDNWRGGDVSTSDTTAPSTPSGLSASGTSSSQISLSWTGSTDDVGVSAYLVERCQGSTCISFAQIGSSPGNSYSDTGLSPATTYRYRVRAADAAGNVSGFSGISSGSTQWAGTLVSDNFDRSNGGLGSNWTAVPGYGGTLQITGNQVQPAAEIFAGSIYTAATVAPAQFSEVQLVSGLSGGVINLDVRAGQYGNLSTVDLYRGQALGLDGIWRILRVDNGVETVLESGALTASNGDTFYFEANGSTLTLKRNGTVLGSATDSTYGSGAVGLSIYNHVNMLVDNWRGGDVNTGDTQAPSAPTNLGGSVISGSQINVSWTASTDNVGVAGYVLERCQGTNCASFAQIATPSSNNYADAGLSTLTSYSYRVKALDQASNASSYSSVAGATTSSGGGGGGDTQPPTSPATLSATPASTAQINLSWAPSTDNVTVSGYKIERCSGSSCTDYSQIANVSAMTYASGGLSYGTTYRYRVRAYDAADNHSPYSPVAVASPADLQAPTSPSGLSTISGPSLIQLFWSPSVDDVAVTNYLLERCLGVGCNSFNEITSLSGSTLYYIDSSITEGAVYLYRVRAKDAANNNSIYSNVKTSSSASEVNTYAYDELGRLIRVQRAGTVNDGVQAEYVLDAAGNRINQTVTTP